MEERIIKDINNLLTQLFQKMHEAGYEWDANKLELRNVELKPKWGNKDTGMIEGIMWIIEQFETSYDGERFSQTEFIKIKDWLKSLKDRVRPKQEWSQNDIDMIDWLIRCCEKEHEELCNDKYGHQDIVSDLKRDCRKKWDWLESLKNRVAPQNHWKPSEEQIKALEFVIESLDKMQQAIGHIDNVSKPRLKEVLAALKKLREEDV